MAICFGHRPDGSPFYWHEDDRPCNWPEQGKYLRDWRRSQGWSLRKLSNHLGVSIVRVSSLERGLAELSSPEARACGYQ